MNKSILKITILGTGTSQGVPVIGCDCPVCQSKNPRDKRLRCSVWVRTGEASIVVDAGPDFRQQMLTANVNNLDAILITHEHNDHIIGLDDVRPFNFKNWKNIPVYATKRVQKELRKRFAYVFSKNSYPGAPMLKLFPIKKEKEFAINNLKITPINVLHGDWPVTGFRFGDFTYLTDMKTLPEKEVGKVRGSKVLVLNALHHKEHHSHLNLKQALEMIEKLNPEQAYLTHMSHRMGLYDEISKDLPPNVELAYDGQEITLPYVH